MDGKQPLLFRILDRESSRESARNQGFPEEYLRYYHTGEDERLLMQQIRPEAVILKESGASGGFSEKLKQLRNWAFASL